MARYHKLGILPEKRHITFYKEDGTLYSEQLVSAGGFSSDYSLTYHLHPPTVVTEIDDSLDVKPKFVNGEMISRCLNGFNVEAEDDFISSRKVVLGNDDVYLSLASPRKSMTDVFYKNSQADEIIFVHIGSGILKTMYGNIDFKSGDHLVIPKGVTYQMHFENENNRLFIVESFSPFRFPSKYQNRSGQLMEHSPFFERDIRIPSVLEPIDQKGDFKVIIKRDDRLYPYHYASHPFDVVGWDGYYYPYALSIHDFQPITGRLHLPPPIHQTWETDSFVMCAFVPRLYDYHPQSIPAPYNHANIDSDEVLYYVDGEFMSRNDIKPGQITLHPLGITHGPHPGAAERSIGQVDTKELAVMVDTFRPLKVTQLAVDIEVKDYYKSWKRD
jgi:homogentisate 1,2-dioxygenase